MYPLMIVCKNKELLSRLEKEIHPARIYYSDRTDINKELLALSKQEYDLAIVIEDSSLLELDLLEIGLCSYLRKVFIYTTIDIPHLEDFIKSRNNPFNGTIIRKFDNLDYFIDFTKKYCLNSFMNFQEHLRINKDVLTNL